MTKESVSLRNLVFSRGIRTTTNIFSLTRKSQLHSIICNNKGVPDYLAINIYYDTLRSWYTPNKMKNVDGEVIYISKPNE